MLKKTIEYVDLDGTKKKEEMYFNLTKAELTEIVLKVTGGNEDEIKKLSESKTTVIQNAETFKSFITKSYGKKTADGLFVKKTKDGYPLEYIFEASPAYDALYMELIQDEKKASAFLEGIMPAEAKEVLKQQQKAELEKVAS